MDSDEEGYTRIAGMIDVHEIAPNEGTGRAIVDVASGRKALTSLVDQFLHHPFFTL